MANCDCDSNCVVEAGIDYMGFDIGQNKTDGEEMTALECADICKEDSQCKFWTLEVEYTEDSEALSHGAGTNICKKKTSDAGRRDTGSFTHSGNLACAGELSKQPLSTINITEYCTIQPKLSTVIL